MKLQKCFGFGIQKIASDMVSGGRARIPRTDGADDVFFKKYVGGPTYYFIILIYVF